MSTPTPAAQTLLALGLCLLARPAQAFVSGIVVGLVGLDWRF